MVIDEDDIKNNPDRFFKNILILAMICSRLSGFEFNDKLSKNVFSEGNKAALDRYNSYYNTH